jgi:hypothetical protein
MREKKHKESWSVFTQLVVAGSNTWGTTDQLSWCFFFSLVLLARLTPGSGASQGADLPDGWRSVGAGQVPPCPFTI